MMPLIFHFPDDEAMAQKLIASLDAQAGVLEWRHFPDRESLITLHGECAGRDVIIVCTLTDPDAKMLPLHFSAATVRELGARRVGLVAPYLGYMRQDHRFLPGQSRSAHAFAKLLSTSFDWLVTVDPHLHRISSLDEIFSIPATSVSAMPAVSEFIAAHVQNPVLIGPDRESAQWAERVARSLNVPWVVLEKTRSGDRQVKVSRLDPGLVHNRNPVIIDDIASSGHTLAEVLKGLTPLGLDNVTCIVVHALFSEGAESVLRSAGARHIVSTNTVKHATNRIDVAPLISSALCRILSQSEPSQ
jgi:ribose-phosphate pyrophosphokinase